jgi:glycosyltransferase involved in cell wall biosynthesis
MHILVIPSEAYVPAESPLSGIFQKDQAEALKRAGFDVGVVTVDLESRRFFGRKSRADSHGFRTGTVNGIPCHRFRSWNWFSVFGNAAACAWIQAGMAVFGRYIAQRGRPDLIHAHNGILAGRLAQRIQEEFGIPYVITEHSSDFARGVLSKATLAGIGKAYVDCSLLICVSKSLGEQLESLYGERVHRWVWIPNMLDRSFEANATACPEPEKAGMAFRFLNIGSLEEVKGHVTLINAFARHFRNDGTVQLRIGGDGTLKEKLPRLIEELGLNGQVELLGYLNRGEVLREVRECDAFVFSSHYETFGVALIEALSCGKPVISTDCGGPGSIVEPANGVLVPIQDMDALGRAMVAMRSHIAEFDGEKIRAACIARFGQDAVVRQLSEAYERVLGKKGTAESSSGSVCNRWW